LSIPHGNSLFNPCFASFTLSAMDAIYARD
jgi:hypothetical protein